jgi:HSP20 family protein
MWTRANDLNRLFGSMDLLRSRMDRLFSDFDRSYGDDFGWKSLDGGPKTNMYDMGDKLQIVVEIPGISKEDMDVRIQGNYLELSGSRKSDAPEGYKSHRVERGTATFTRSFTLPADIDPEGVEAVMKDGILTMILPKVEAAKPRQITIR